MNATKLLHAIAYRQAEMKGAGEAFATIFGRPDFVELPHVTDDPNLLGSLLEESREPHRAAMFAELTAGTNRHEGTLAVSTTQRFTPPWLARWLADESIRACTGDPWPCIDPACGGGQLLITLYEALRALGRSPGQILASDVVGYDIDPSAAAAASWSLWLRAVSDEPECASTLPSPRVFAPLTGSSSVIETGALGCLETLARETGERVDRGRFAVVVANPPYMGARHLTPGLRGWLRDHYGPFAGDLYTAFIRRCTELARPRGGMAILCQHSFLFLERDRALRRSLFADVSLHELLHLGSHAFEKVLGEKATVVAFSATVGERPDFGEPRFVDLTDLRRPADKEAQWNTIRAEGFAHRRVYRGRAATGRAQQGQPLAYWWPDALASLLDAPDRLEHFVEIPGAPNKTADNRRFVRYWWEVSRESMDEGRWIPYAKGGPRRKWVGNLERVVDWSPEAREYYHTNPTSNLLAERYWFREGLTWSDFGGRTFSARHLPAGCLFDMAGPAIFVRDADAGPSVHFWLALVNSPLVRHLLNADNSTIHYQVSNLRGLPMPPPARLLDPAAVDALESLARTAGTAATRLASWSPAEPLFDRPLLLALAPLPSAGAGLDELVCRAQAEWLAVVRTLDAAETEIARRVEKMYGAPRDGVAELDRRDTASDRRPPPRNGLIEFALLHVREVADGLRAGPTPDDTRGFEAIGLALYGPAAWREMLGEMGGERSVAARVQRVCRAVYRGRPWHPDRIAAAASGSVPPVVAQPC
jgi:hypothetical protein